MGVANSDLIYINVIFIGVYVYIFITYVCLVLAIFDASLCDGLCSL